MAWPWDDEIAAPEQAAAMAPTAPPAALMRAPEGGGMDWRTGLLLAGQALRGGGGASILPSILAMKKQQQAQQQRGMQATEIGRIESALAESIEETGGDFGAAITGYRQRLGAEPFQSPEAAQASVRVITGLRDKALQQQKVRAVSGLFADALDQAAPNETGYALAGRLIAAGKAQGFDVTKEALDLAKLKNAGFHVFNNGGIVTAFNQETNEALQFGAQLIAPSSGQPAQVIRPGAAGAFSAEAVPGSYFQAPERTRPTLRVPTAPGPAPGAMEGPEQLAGPPAPGFEVAYQAPRPPQEPLPPGFEVSSVTSGPEGETSRTLSPAKGPDLDIRTKAILAATPGVDPRAASSAQIAAARRQALSEELMIAAGKAKAGIEAQQAGVPTQRIQQHSAEYLDAKTGQPVPPSLTWEAVDQQLAGRDIVHVPSAQQREFVQTVKPDYGYLTRLRKVIETNDTLFPDVDTKNLPAALARIGQAKIQAMLTGDVDPDTAWMRGTGKLQAIRINKTYGEVGNMAQSERAAGLDALGARPMAKKAAMALVDDLIGVQRDRMGAMGFTPESFLGPDPRVQKAYVRDPKTGRLVPAR